MMKADRRHELQQNELAKWVAPKVQAAKPYGMLILGVIVAVVAIVVTIVLIQNSNAAEKEGQWAEVMRLTSSEYFIQQAEKKQREMGDIQLTAAQLETLNDDIERDLRDVIAQDENTLAALRGKLFLADRARTRGISAIFTDRAAAEGDLEDAIKLYTEIAAAAEVETFRERAEFYRADTLIARSGIVSSAAAKSDLEEAKKIYKNLSAKGVFSQAATEQLAILDRPSANGEDAYFVWFNERLQNMPSTNNNTSSTPPTTTGNGDTSPANVGLGGITDGFGQSTGGSTGPTLDPPDGGN